ncbi:MAG: hypothetical protein HY283_04385 [Nitrospirae bacterium]|nr:hypothetical protein [Nitrospirota bacterium]
MIEGYFPRILVALVLVPVLTGCWKSSQDQAAVSFPINAMAIDPTSCSCSQGGNPIPCPTQSGNPVPDQTACNVVYAATEGGGIFKTEDDGTTWRFLGGLTDVYVKALAVDPHPDAGAPRLLYVGTEDGGVFRSYDGGQTWTPQIEAQPISSISKIVVDPNTCTVNNPPCNEIYAASRRDGVWKSVNRGSSWTKMTTNGLTATVVSSLALSPKGISPTKVYAGTEGGHVFKYDPITSAAWTEGATAATPLPEEVISLAVQPLTGIPIYAGLSGGENGIGGGGVYRTDNDGIFWGRVDIPAPRSDSVFVLSFILQPDPFTGPDVVVYASVFGLSQCLGTCTASTDWQAIDVGRDKGVTALAIDPYAHTTLYVGTLLGELFRSTDRGATWTKLAFGF